MLVHVTYCFEPEALYSTEVSDGILASSSSFDGSLSLHGNLYALPCKVVGVSAVLMTGVSQYWRSRMDRTCAHCCKHMSGTRGTTHWTVCQLA